MQLSSLQSSPTGRLQSIQVAVRWLALLCTRTMYIVPCTRYDVCTQVLEPCAQRTRTSYIIVHSTMYKVALRCMYMYNIVALLVHSSPTIYTYIGTMYIGTQQSYIVLVRCTLYMCTHVHRTSYKQSYLQVCQYTQHTQSVSSSSRASSHLHDVRVDLHCCFLSLSVQQLQ